MRNFCTDIQETAKIRGLSRGGECRNRGGSYSITTRTTHISFDITIERDNDMNSIINNSSNSELKKIFSEVKPKEIETQSLDIINKIIGQFIS